MVYSVNKRNKKRGHGMVTGGFTLIETLVALLVVAIAYAGVATAVSQFVDQRLMLVERHSSHRIAWNRLMEQYLVSQGMELDEQNFAEKQGETTLQGVRWRWQLREEKTASGELVRYQVDVYLTAGDQSRDKGATSADGSLSADGSQHADGSLSADGSSSAKGSLTAYFVP